MEGIEWGEEGAVRYCGKEGTEWGGGTERLRRGKKLVRGQEDSKEGKKLKGEGGLRMNRGQGEGTEGKKLGKGQGENKS